jgi:hypothetical protein
LYPTSWPTLIIIIIIIRQIPAMTRNNQFEAYLRRHGVCLLDGAFGTQAFDKTTADIDNGQEEEKKGHSKVNNEDDPLWGCRQVA